LKIFNSSANLRNINKLTALWALSESGLGGILHGLQIPFSGFFLAAFAIIIIRLIAFNAKNPFQSVLKATLLVLLLKAAVSPQSPVTAYFAVAFQGFLGALIFGSVKNQNIASYLTSIFCLMETAIQKLLVLFILFGTSFIDATDAFIADVFQKLDLQVNSFSFWVMIGYLSIYFLWAIYIGYISSGLPVEIKNRHIKFEELGFANENKLVEDIKKDNNVWHNLILTSFGFVLIYGLAISFDSNTLMITFYRTLIIILLWWILSPLIKKTMFWFLDKRRATYSRDFSSIFSMLPQLKSKVKPAFAMAKADVKGIAIYKEFVFNMVALSLYEDGNEK
jgi:hypothetical protein